MIRCVLFSVILSLLLMSCSQKEAHNNDQPESILTGWQIKKSLVFEYKDTAFPYSLALPDDYGLRENIPLIIYLHGSGGDENSDLPGFTAYIDSIAKACQKPRPVIAFPGNSHHFFILDNNWAVSVGLSNYIAASYPVADAPKRLLSGFSIGAAAALRAVLIYPGEFSQIYSWGGGVWSKDQFLFESIERNADELQKSNTSIVLIQGDNDQPLAYDFIGNLLSDHNVNHEVVILDNLQHNLGHYLTKSHGVIKSHLCDFL